MEKHYINVFLNWADFPVLLGCLDSHWSADDPDDRQKCDHTNTQVWTSDDRQKCDHTNTQVWSIMGWSHTHRSQFIYQIALKGTISRGFRHTFSMIPTNLGSLFIKVFSHMVSISRRYFYVQKMQKSSNDTADQSTFQPWPLVAFTVRKIK